MREYSYSTSDDLLAQHMYGWGCTTCALLHEFEHQCMQNHRARNGVFRVTFAFRLDSCHFISPKSTQNQGPILRESANSELP